VTPGQFFILKFDFSSVYRGPNINKANQSLQACINCSLETFYSTYASYWDRDESELYKNIYPEDPVHSLRACSRVVTNLLENAKERDNSRLASIKGVRTNRFLIDSPQSLTFEFLFP